MPDEPAASDRGWWSRCRARRAPRPRACSSQLVELLFGEHRFVVAFADGARERADAAASGSPVRSRRPRPALAACSTAASCSSRFKVLNSKRSNSSASFAVSGGARRELLDLHRQRDVALDRQQLPRPGQPVERLAQVLADHAADLAGVRDHVVERAVLREPLDRGLRADLVHAGTLSIAVADQREVVDEALRRARRTSSRRRPRRASRWTWC